ncbi:tetratricopeptide repeat protein [Maridesulfovibrio frigidus]|uniref:tetratricopeptide repeat protein n=1 Tax=Maridesulfovibrio frigidus TaxID=340956 RepID=UPI00054EA5EF|nr:tetratricopeptide repeat protein [Maridesulfovibrio frigidus]
MAAFIWLVCPYPGLAMEYFVDTKSDMDSLRFVFDQKNLSGTVRRSGREELTITFPTGALRAEKLPTPMSLSGLRIINSIKMGPSSLVIGTRTTGFGFIRIPGGNGEMVLQFFRDPIGSKWRTPTEKAARVAAASPPPAVIEQDVQPPIIDEIDIDPESEGESLYEDDEVAPVQNEEVESVQDETVLPDPVVTERPVSSVPYTYRSPISKVGPAEAVAVDTSQASARAGGSVRSEPVNGPVSGSVGGQVSPPDGQVEGSITGSVSPPEVQPPDDMVIEDDGPDEFDPEAGGPDDVEEQVFPQAQPEGAVVRRVSPPVQDAGSVSGQISRPPSQASGSVTPPPGQTSGQVTPPPQSDFIPAANDEFPAAEGDDNYYGAAENGTDDDFYGENDNATDDGEFADLATDDTDAFPVEEGGPAEGEDGETKELTLEEKLKVARGIMLVAESALEEGQIQVALEAYEEVLVMPYLTKDLRIKALYGKAEALTELHKDDLQNNFGDVSSSWMEAMNSDTNSPNVPMALLNLGLINLKAGNMPEAKAYFNLLKSQYPNDLNIPYISFYWGEYYLGIQEYEKAADQFQNLVQTYPDSKVVREAALGLAKSLDALGYNEQSFQIIDYIDKRWPRYYIEDLEFLLMAANTQNRLGKVDDAKENYWAFYNLAPDSKENDIVLARLGDIYLKNGDTKAAKDLYEKAAEDYPEEEGGLVSMMRLAEEGIYDNPDMNQMDKVFDRPYNLRPQKIYTQIIEKHPNSPLAPLAQLKLGMWYYWNKKYGECLGSVQDFLDKYPRSTLRTKASELGHRVFDKAVPELVQDENYGRVVKFWNSYGKKNNEGDGVNDETRMGVALSYWKKEQPNEALKLIDRYLTEKQVPKYSAMALDMALGIYVEEQAWSKVTELVDLARNNWELDPKQSVHIDFAKAMAFENLGETELSTPLWAGLASNLLLPESSRAYAMYYMAKSAMKKKELKKVFIYAQEALAMLLQTGGDREKIKDCILMTIFAAESSGRYREALKWAAEYDKYIPISDPEWASSRFRLAQLYEKAGAIEEWGKLMEEVAKKSPDDLYGRLATSALATRKIERDASKFDSGSSF